MTNILYIINRNEYEYDDTILNVINTIKPGNCKDIRNIFNIDIFLIQFCTVIYFWNRYTSNIKYNIIDYIIFGKIHRNVNTTNLIKQWLAFCFNEQRVYIFDNNTLKQVDELKIEDFITSCLEVVNLIDNICYLYQQLRKISKYHGKLYYPYKISNIIIAKEYTDISSQDILEVYVKRNNNVIHLHGVFSEEKYNIPFSTDKYFPLPLQNISIFSAYDMVKKYRVKTIFNGGFSIDINDNKVYMKDIFFNIYRLLNDPSIWNSIFSLNKETYNTLSDDIKKTIENYTFTTSNALHIYLHDIDVRYNISLLIIYIVYYMGYSIDIKYCFNRNENTRVCLIGVRELTKLLLFLRMIKMDVLSIVIFALLYKLYGNHKKYINLWLFCIKDLTNVNVINDRLKGGERDAW